MICVLELGLVGLGFETSVMCLETDERLLTDQSQQQPSNKQRKREDGAEIVRVEEHDDHETVERQTKQIHHGRTRPLRNHASAESAGRRKIESTSQLKTR